MVQVVVVRVSVMQLLQAVSGWFDDVSVQPMVELLVSFHVPVRDGAGSFFLLQSAKRIVDATVRAAKSLWYFMSCGVGWGLIF